MYIPTAIGFSNYIDGAGYALGYQNDIAFGIAIGNEHQISTTNGGATAIGSTDSVYADYSTALGYRNRLDGQAAVAGGIDNKVKSGADYSIALGQANTTNGIAAVALGFKNTAGHNYSFALGHSAATTTINQFVSRFSNGYRLESNAAGTAGVSLAAGAGTWASISDRRAKDHIDGLNYGLSTVMQMKPATYTYKGSNTLSLGFIAQEMKEVVPEVVNVPENKKEMMSIRYTELIPVLTKAIQELNDKVETLEAQNAQLKAQNSELSQLKAEVASIKALLQQSGIDHDSKVSSADNK